jgi:hypothetical protein
VDLHAKLASEGYPYMEGHGAENGNSTEKSLEKVTSVLQARHIKEQSTTYNT